MHSEFEQLRIASQTNVRLRKESIIADYESQEERARQRYLNSANDLRDSLAKLSKVQIDQTKASALEEHN